MGTNYYWHGNVCPTCSRAETLLHIGKSSAGWCFGLHVIPEEQLNTLDDWWTRMLTGGGIIKNEYEDILTPSMMRDVIINRKCTERADSQWSQMGYIDESDFHTKNHSERGPNGLLRHAIDGRHCIGHGDGTWDYITGEFS